MFLRHPSVHLTEWFAFPSSALILSIVHRRTPKVVQFRVKRRTRVDSTKQVGVLKVRDWDKRYLSRTYWQRKYTSGPRTHALLRKRWIEDSPTVCERSGEKPKALSSCTSKDNSRDYGNVFKAFHEFHVSHECNVWLAWLCRISSPVTDGIRRLGILGI